MEVQLSEICARVCTRVVQKRAAPRLESLQEWPTLGRGREAEAATRSSVSRGDVGYLPRHRQVACRKMSGVLMRDPMVKVDQEPWDAMSSRR